MKICPCCENKVERFEPTRITKRKNALCPVCGSAERHRLMWLYLEDLLEPGKSLLGIGVLKNHQKILRKRIGKDFTSMDCVLGVADIQADISIAGSIKDKYDIIICSHVLEHVADDQVALLEIKRSLSVGGVALVVVPIKKNLLKTVEFSQVESGNHNDMIEKEKKHGHVRAYGRDFVHRLKNIGFNVKEGKGCDWPVEKYGLQKDEIIFVST